MDERIKVIFGGAFDPPHLGHFEIVRKLLRFPAVESVVIMPACRPPHKSPVASFEQRLQMSRLAFGRLPGVEIFNEDNSEPVTYTCDVVQRLPGWGTQRYALVLGMDEVKDLILWKTPEKIFEHAGLIMVRRQGVPFPYKSLIDIGARMGRILDLVLGAPSFEISSEFGISSSEIRSSSLDDIRKKVHFRVWKYIRDTSLYGSQKEA